ncbi:uncharacterized protein MCAP_0864-like isoform X2 [Mercenaria mercenaria]|uniref:uncharacterized protein MCAP_0864-like isoform X2 n=1 Tax=Mercenaria mercenaria TaxID=6596 RepID=UPI00234F6E9A|nr:uncharacterized protein MCAP_0864-like isoform X2 [Mercenaria mercenaria]
MPPKQLTKASTGSRPKSTATTEKRKDETKSPKEAESREVVLEREIMMLRKNLNMTEIMKEFRKTVPENHMQTMFFESLHELENKLQKYESGTGLPARGSLSDLQMDLDRERANIKSLKQEISAKNKMLDDNRKLIIEKDKALRKFETEFELQKAHARHSAEAVVKLQKLQTEHEALQKNMEGKESIIRALSQEIENLKKELAMTERREINEKEEERTAEIKALTRKQQQSERMFQEYEAQLKENQKLLEERNKVIEKLNEENNRNPPEDEGKENELSKLRNTVEELKGKISNERAGNKREILELRKVLDERTENFKALEEEKLRISNEKAEKEKELSNLIETLSHKEKRIDELETKLKSPDNSNKVEADGLLREKTDEINRLKTELQEVKTAKEMIKREKEKLEFTCHDAFDKLEKKEKTMKQQQEEHNKLILRKDETIQKLRREKTMVDPTAGGKANIETKSLVDKYEKTEKELKNAKNEIDELKQRLYKVGGANIMSGNPNITDLSDDNRPSKLSEKFSELYENEWTNAYEEVERECKTEEKSIGYLYKTLGDIFDFCRTIAEEHGKSIQACLLTIPYAANARPKSAKLGVTSLRQLKELRKIVAPYLVGSVFQHFVDTMQINLTGKKKTENFIKGCVEICWLMNSLDPPVILDTVNGKGNKFDGDKFRTYTKTGQLIDYVVWPPVLLHKDGPLLCKGVAQGR